MANADPPGTTAADLFREDERTHWDAIAARAKHTVYGGDCYTYAQLAAGFVDVVFESGLQTYDFCALAPVIESAGGIVTDWRGNPLSAIPPKPAMAACNKSRRDEGDSGMR